MKKLDKMKKMSFIALIILFATQTAFAQDIINKLNFGGNATDSYRSVAVVHDGFVAVGLSNPGSFGNGDWTGDSGKGNIDAIIVKYNKDGSIDWKKTHGGSDWDQFNNVTAVLGGCVAVGYSWFNSFGNGDWAGAYGHGVVDAVTVKYAENGNVLWRRAVGGTEWDEFLAATAVADGVVVVGYSEEASFNTGSWEGYAGKGGLDATILKYDNNGNTLWKKNFGGAGFDQFHSVTAVADGIIAVGYSSAGSFGNNDWNGVSAKGEYDAIIVKFDNDGNIVWKKNFGGSSNDEFYAVNTVSDGIVAVGFSNEDSFGNNDWTGLVGKGDRDAIIVKYDNSGNIVWKKNFGGSDQDYFNDIIAVTDGIITVGHSYENSFGNGDWYGINGMGDRDASIIKYENNGNIVWKKNLGGNSWDYFYGVDATDDGFITVGFSGEDSFGNGNWSEITGKGEGDATIMIYGDYESVTEILYLPESANINEALELTGTVMPNNATYQSITWSIVNAGTTGAEINNNEFLATSVGAATVMASVTNGVAFGTAYTKHFTITVIDPNSISEIVASEIIIYPNPACDKLKVDASTSLSTGSGELKICKLEIYGISGKRLKEIANPSAEIDVSDLMRGMYFIKIKTEKGEVVRKFIKN